tara:strand:- start:114 stop:743 length:630 start_codon:yes stop_codon:yes gene_type:complete
MVKLLYKRVLIQNLCVNKNVLHLGYVAHDNYQAMIQNNAWLHSELSEVALSITGIDYLSKEVKELCKLGYDGYTANVMRLENLNLDKKFDVVVCGDLIGHIENPGLMLEGIKKFMDKNAILAITCPNPYSLARIMKIFQKKLDRDWINDELVSWHSFGTLEHLLIRANYKIRDSGYYAGYVNNNLIKDKMKSILPQFLQDGIYYVAQNK